MQRLNIEAAARELQVAIWSDRAVLWPLGLPPLKAMFEPAIACRVLGYEYDLRDGLGGFGNGKDRFEIAGMIDRQRKIIAVSTRHGYDAMRFTGAHEVAHLRLHNGMVMHRDRPVSEVCAGWKSLEDQDADYFAACYLAPAKLVVGEFVRRYGTKKPLPLTDTVAWHLCGEQHHQLMSARPDSLDFAVAVSTAASFDGRRFSPMTTEFGLSPKAMALRLKELGLILD